MHSMTGYGTAAGKVGRGRLYLEIKSVNHRYCEISLKLPPKMGALENPLREALQKAFQRGRIECFIKEVEPVLGPAELTLDIDLARGYQKALRRLRKELNIAGPADPIAAAGLDPFVRVREPEGNYLKNWKAVERLLARAVNAAQAMRRREGQYLLQDQKRRLKMLERHLVRMRSRFLKRRHHGVTAVDNNNGPDKTDITEELTRLQSHVRQYAGLLGKGGVLGRRLDFLIQEMHREVNTIGAKASDAKISGGVVEVKSLLENLREQVQNIV